MIYTLTLNPALDLSGHVARLVPNEKNYVLRERRDPGGNGINAARVARRLGARVLALGFAGGAAGDEIRSMLDGEKVPHRFTPIAGHTRVNVTVTNDADHQQTRLTFRGPEVRAAETRALLRQLRALRAPGLIALGGSSPPGAPETLLAQAAREAQRAGLDIVLDVPAKHLALFYRSTRATPLLVKPNQTELEEWTGKRHRTDGALAEAARKLVSQGCARFVCVSLAERGAILASAGGAWFGHAPKVKARGTVGAGDSMVGAICAWLDRHGASDKSMLEALRWGLAAGAATASVEGTTLARAADVRRLHHRTRVTAL